MFSAIRDGLLIGGSLVANTTDNSNIRLQKRLQKRYKKEAFFNSQIDFCVFGGLFAYQYIFQIR